MFNLARSSLRKGTTSRACFVPGTASAAGIGAAAFGPGAVFDETNLSAVDLGAVQLLQSPLHVGVQPELDHPFVLSPLVRVGVSHLARLSHVILQNEKGTFVMAAPRYVKYFSLRAKKPTFKSCQLHRLDRFSTMSR